MGWYVQHGRVSGVLFQALRLTAFKMQVVRILGKASLIIFKPALHIPPILSTHLKHGMGDLTQGAVLSRFHQLRESVFIFESRLL